ncbi:M20/M25/M40 family metallo-hydrolase [Stappia indica]|uniref:M20/M25/M40 family metallo-hydrolase n=1 Tax=Stappia indica TaxID=538381 RepID=UPI001CD4AC93|nr:M20/M25/M40 family metallo-hydrolase [Stappia indica]MCA1296979.1 M20/M25/M40 family metallo-hydrolase [Stappia indica]
MSSENHSDDQTADQSGSTPDRQPNAASALQLLSRLGSAIDARWAEQRAFLKTLVRMPSEIPPGDMDPFASDIADALQALGLEVERHPVPEPFVRQTGMRSVTNLIVRRVFADGRGPVIALCSHADVVPPGEGWHHAPYGATEENGLLFGRGTAFGKSDIAAYTFALLALEEEARAEGAAKLSGTVELHITFDEEAGGYVGPSWILGQELSKPDFAIASGFSRFVTTAHSGCLHQEIIVRGRAAHAAEPGAGVDALEAATRILHALYRERDRLSSCRSALDPDIAASLTIGLIQGGVNTNVVPDRVLIRLDRRLLPEEDGETVEQALSTLIQNAAGEEEEGLEVECRRILLAEPLRPVTGVGTLASAAHRHIREIFPDADTRTSGSPIFSDARHYAAAGIPTILYGSGPTSLTAANAHGADEHVLLSDLRAATVVVAATLGDLLRT